MVEKNTAFSYDLMKITLQIKQSSWINCAKFGVKRLRFQGVTSISYYLIKFYMPKNAKN